MSKTRRAKDNMEWLRYNIEINELVKVTKDKTKPMQERADAKAILLTADMLLPPRRGLLSKLKGFFS